MRKRPWKQILLTAAILFQLCGAIFIPNLTSYTGGHLAKFYLPYMNGLGLGGVWSFFAPEPFSPPMYIDYTLTIPGEVPVSGRFPDVNEEFFQRSSTNRRTSIARYILSSDKHVEFMFMNYLCHRYPKAESAKVWGVRGHQPDYNMVHEQGKKMSETIDYSSTFVGEYACKRSG